MLKTALTAAALCGTVPSFAATVSSFQGAVLATGIDGTIDDPTDDRDSAYAATFIGPDKTMPPLFMATGTDESFESSLDKIDAYAVPETGALALMAAGLLGLFGMGARRMRSR
jgi:hypothetical protein